LGVALKLRRTQKVGLVFKIETISYLKSIVKYGGFYKAEQDICSANPLTRYDFIEPMQFVMIVTDYKSHPWEK